MTTEPAPQPTRIASLDQFRGYTVAGMFLVNFIGRFAAVHDIFKHHNTYNSYADTIMPHFFFAVGFAMRLGFLRKRNHGQLVRRSLGLMLLGVMFYGFGGNFPQWSDLTALTPWAFVEKCLLRTPFQALTSIGLTSLWLVPVIGRRSRDLLLYAIAGGLLHLWLSQAFWFDYLMKVRVIDGGPLGFLTWALPTLAGALAYDAVQKFGAPGALAPLLRWGALLSLTGYAISCVHGWEAPPFWPPWHPVDLWTMTQRAGSLSYQTFSAGFSLIVYAAFLWACDVRQPSWSWPFFRTLGTNALAAYLIHSMVGEALHRFGPKDSPLAWAILLTALYFAVTYLFLRFLERREIYLRI